MHRFLKLIWHGNFIIFLFFGIREMNMRMLQFIATAKSEGKIRERKVL